MYRGPLGASPSALLAVKASRGVVAGPRCKGPSRVLNRQAMPQTESEKRTPGEDAWPSPPLERSKPTRSRETSAPCNLAAMEAATATLSESRAPMDPLAALLSERPPHQLSATELHSRIALLEDAARAFRAEKRSCGLLSFSARCQTVAFLQPFGSSPGRRASLICSAFAASSRHVTSQGSHASRPLHQLLGRVHRRHEQR